MKKLTYITLVAMLVMSSCGEKKATQVVEQEELPIVTVDVVHAREVPQHKEYTATVEAENVNNISPNAPNRIKSITVDAGDNVHTGQLLVTLDDSNAEQLRINIEQIEREYNRARQLLDIGAGTQQAVDQLQAQLDATRTQYANVLENTQLRSPINGVVTARNYDPGDMTGNLPVLTVGQVVPTVKVMLNVSENDFAKVTRGLPVTVTFDAYGDRTFSGTVTRVYPTIDANTRTFQVEVKVNNPGGEIRPGMFARVGVDFGTQNNVVVPDRAVVKQTGSGNKYVYVYANGKVSYNRVQLGQRMDDAYELLEGVSDGDTVVISGQTRLADGVKVEIR